MATLSPVTSPLLPGPGEAQVLAGRYALERPLGSGGYATVWQAFDRKLGRRVAIKRLAQPTPRVLARFEREMRVLASLRHPNVVGLLDTGQDEDGRPFLVMELIEGQSLAELTADRPLEPLHAARVVRDAALGVAHAHDHDLLHRDLKPENVLVEDDDGRGRVVDFGVALLLGDAARLTGVGGSPGTPAYMAPEQVAPDGAASAQSDVYALGATLYFALTGAPPFEADSLPRLALRIVDTLPTSTRAARPAVPPALDALVLRCLAKDPTRRPRGARALAEELERLLARPAAAAPGLGLAGEGSSGPALALADSGGSEPILLDDDEEEEHEDEPPADERRARRRETSPLEALAPVLAAARRHVPTPTWHTVGRLLLAAVALIVIVNVARRLRLAADVASTRPPTPGQGAKPPPPPSRRPPAPTTPAPPASPSAPAPAPSPPAPTPAAPAEPADAALAARQLLAEGRVREALPLLGRALQAAPRDVELLALRADARRRCDDPAGAEQDLKALVALAPDRMEAWATLARLLLNRGAGAPAAEAAARAIALEPDRAELHVLRGQGLVLARDLRGAEAAFGRALELDPRQRAALRSRAEARRKLGDAAGADADMAELDRLTSLPEPEAAPTDTGAWPQLLARGLGPPPPPHPASFLASWAAQDPVALQGQARDWRGQVNLGHALAAHGSWSAALESYGKAVKDDPARAEPRVARGDALLVLGRPRDALQDYEAALADPSPAAPGSGADAAAPRLGGLAAARRGRALALGCLGRLSEAREELERALGAEPNAPAGLAIQSHLLELEGKLPEAVQSVERALQLGGGRAPALLRQQARLLLQLGQAGPARTAAERALEYAPEDPEATLVLAAIDLVQGQRSSARTRCERLLERGVRADARVLLGLLRAADGDLEGARGEVEVALGRPQEAPPEAWGARGLLRHATGREGARADLERFLELRPAHPAAPLAEAALRDAR